MNAGIQARVPTHTHMRLKNADRSTGRSRWGLLLLAVCGLLVLTQCDSGIDPYVEPPPSETDVSPRIEAVQKWYKTALAEEQSAPAKLPEGAAGKISEDSTLAAILEAMVSAYPPDWDQMETWDNGIGGYYAATTLGPATGSPSHPEVSVVRTLVADVDENGQILSGRLVEFVAPDLDASLFRDYVVQWLSGAFDSMRILVPEYTIGYASTQAFLYEPGKAPEPVEMQLVSKDGMGKTHASEWFCWESDYTRGGDVCFPSYGNVCNHTPAEIEITCVCVSGCGDDDDGGGGGDDGGDDDGGGGDDTGGGDGEDDEEEEEEDEITFSFGCLESVVRGGSASCVVNVKYPEDTPEQVYQFSWSSSEGRVLLTSDANSSEWSGVATKEVTVTVAVKSEEWSDSKTIKVKPRTGYSAPKLRADVEYSGDLSGNRHGDYALTDPGKGPTLLEGTGPWAGTVMAGPIAALSSRLRILDDYDPAGGPKYDGVHNNTCDLASEKLEDSDSWLNVNDGCGTSAGYGAMRDAIIAHERAREAGFNTCLSNAANFTELEAILDAEKINNWWNEFAAGRLFHAGEKAPGYDGGTADWWHNLGGRGWQKGILPGKSTAGNVGCPSQ